MKRFELWKKMKDPKFQWRALAACVATIAVTSIAANLLATSSGKVEMHELLFDARGAVISAELYTPKGVSAADSLPAVVLAHGGACTNGVMAGNAQELARRGFVVLNVNAYGAGLSETPITDDSDSPPGGFMTARGMIDAVEYLRTLTYVDQERIGLAGHSMGALRTAVTTMANSSYLTPNDLAINRLYNTFGVKLTEEEITMDADTLAEKYLDANELRNYQLLKEEDTAYYNTRVKAWMSMGIGELNNQPLESATVQVGGYDVQRYLGVNIGFLNAKNDENTSTMGYDMTGLEGLPMEDVIKRSLVDKWQTENEVTPEQWYSIELSPENGLGHSTQLGNINEVSVATDEALAQAAENRSLRMLFIPDETHSQNFFSLNTSRYLVRFFEQTLNYNNGDLGAEGSSPVDTNNIIWFWREAMNGIAMFAMFAMLFPLAAILLRQPLFAGCASEMTPPSGSKKNAGFWVVSLLLALVGFLAVAYLRGWKGISAGGLRLLKTSALLPADVTPTLCLNWILIVALAAVVVEVIYKLIRKESPMTLLTDYKVNIGFGPFLKTMLLGAILFAAAFLTLCTVKYFTGQDFRLWMVGFDVMDEKLLLPAIRYTIVCTPIFLIHGIVINSGRMKDMPGGLNTFVNLLLADLGLIVPLIINLAYVTVTNQPPFTTFYLVCLGIVLMVLVNGYINRKMYELSGSVWLGAVTNAWLVAWLWMSITDTAIIL